MLSAAIGSVSAVIDEKLGRCSTCIRQSVGLSLAFLMLLAVLIVIGAGNQLTIPIAIIATASTILASAHGVAYVVRDNSAPKRCTPCEARARARRRAERHDRILSWLSGGKSVSLSLRVTPCRTCRKAKSVEELIETADELPRADHGLRAIVESSAEYQSLLSRLSPIEPIDTWRVESRHHFVYRLRPNDDARQASALFVARWEDYAPLSAVLITPDPNGGEPQVVDLRA